MNEGRSSIKNTKRVHGNKNLIVYAICKPMHLRESIQLGPEKIRLA